MRIHPALPAPSRADPGGQAPPPSPLLVLDAARRLGPRAVARLLGHRLAAAAGRHADRLRDASPPAGPFLASTPAPAAPAADWHGPFDGAAPALSLDLFGPGDVRPLWERGRLLAVPRLVARHRAAPGAGHLDAAEALLAGWVAANPPFRGPHWACGQEAALRGLHLALASALLGTPPSPGLRALLALHARRVAATPLYALAQDNNHPVSEAAGLYGLGLAIGDAALARHGARRLARAAVRLVSPCGAFAQPGTGYARLLVDTLAVAEALRRHHAAPPLPAPVAARARAAAALLARQACPRTGAAPRSGHQDGSALADLEGAGPADLRASLARADHLFGSPREGARASPPASRRPGPAPALPDGPPPARPGIVRWRAEGLLGWEAAGARAVLRAGPLRFRPAHADLLHLDLWDGPLNLLRDGGTGAYNPGPAERDRVRHLAATAGHNTVEFDGQDQMPRLSRFLHARWPLAWGLPDGAAYRDHRGRVHARAVTVSGRAWTVADAVAGPFEALALRWRLAPGPWAPTPDGAALPGGARLSVEADAPLALRLTTGWESPAYGRLAPVPVLEARARAPVARLVTRIRLDG